MEFVSRALFKIEELKARLATVEAERDAAEARHISAEGHLATLMDERDALAAQNVLMREALERVTTITEADNVDSYMLDVHEAERVLAIGKPQAAREVAEWRRDSERLTQMIDVSNRGHGIIDDGTWDLTPIDEDDAQVAARVAIDAAIDAARGVK